MLSIVKKGLILSCGTGEGHNSAAHAIEDALRDRGIEFEMIDPISFRSEGARKRVSSLYNNMIRKTPRMFGVVYKMGSLFEKTRITSPVYYANCLYAEKLGDYIKQHSFDSVICTHLYGMEAMTKVRKNMDIPSFGILTDYTCIPFISETKLDKYFIPVESMIDEVTGKGIPKEKLAVTGIPTAKRFSSEMTKAEARKRLDMPQDSRIYVAATGGVGCEKMEGFCDELLKAEQGDFRLYLLVGRNNTMKERIDKKYENEPHIETVPFTKEINVYMRAADVMISKPGGLSSTEAAVANVPLVHVHTIPGCESANVKFFSENGLSLYAKSSKEAALLAKELTTDLEKAEQMKKNQRRVISCTAAEDIVKEIVRYCYERS